MRPIRISPESASRSSCTLSTPIRSNRKGRIQERSGITVLRYRPAFSAQYLAGLLRKHLAGLTINPDHLPGGEAVGAIFDEGGVQRGTSTDHIASTLPVRETLIENQPGILPGWTMRAGFPEG